MQPWIKPKGVTVEVFVPAPYPTTTHNAKRLVVQGGKAVMFRPPKLREAEKYWGMVAAALKGMLRKEAPQIALPITGPTMLELLLLKARGETGWCTGRPDCSNVLKTAEDALMEAGILSDDSSNVYVMVQKGYSMMPGVEISLTILDEAQGQ